jgi:hypothetical protein
VLFSKRLFEADMDINNQFYSFYKSFLDKFCQSIEKGKTEIFVGINSIGKTLLIEQIKSERFQKEFSEDKKVRFIYLDFKDKNSPKSSQLYRYWLSKTAETIDYKLPDNEIFNDYSFYFHLTEIIRSISEEKLVYVVQDFQKVLDQGEAFFRSLIYLHRYTYRKVLFLIFSEPQILESKNIWAQRFIQDSTNHKFNFLKLFDKKTILADIKREENFLKANIEDRKSLVMNYCGGLHGVIGAICYFLKKNPELRDFRKLKNIVDEDLMCDYWFKDIFQSLPYLSIKILKEVASDNKIFGKYKNNVYANYLIQLGMLKKNGIFPHILMLSSLSKYSIENGRGAAQLKIINNQIYLGNERLKVTKKEKAVLSVLYKSKGKLVTYDQLGENIWKDDPDRFSLWAISQIVRRLRKKLVFNFLPPQTIRSVRGEGYILE